MVTHADARRRVSVAEQQGEHIVLAIMASLGDEGQVRWIGSPIGIAGGLFIWIGAWQGVAKTARASKHLALIIWAVLHLSLHAPEVLQ